MVAEPRTWVDIETALRSWARAALPVLEGRVFFGAPADSALPLVTLHRIAGTDDRCLVQFDCWAALKAEAAITATAVATALDALTHAEHDGVLLHGATVEQIRWLPDEESNTPRYVVEATVVATAG